MRRILSGLLILSVLAQAAAQTATFDLATFTPPAGWERVDNNGTVRIQAPGNRAGYCQIYLFASHPGSADAAQNFAAEWARLIAQPFNTPLQPRVETRQTPDGWTAMSAMVNVVQRGLPVSAFLFTVTGHGRVMSVVVNASGQAYTADVQSFFARLSFHAPEAASSAVAAAPPAAPVRDGGPGELAYTVPQGWTGTNYPDGTVYASPMFNNGERCQISVFPMRPGTGDLLADARRAFAGLFQMDPLQNNAYPYPVATLIRGTAAQGWNYLVVRRSIRGQVGEYGSLLGVTLLAAQQGQQVAIVVSTGKDPLVSQCFGALVHDEWPAFFHSLQLRTFPAVPQEQRVRQSLAGAWTTATGTVADRYTFAPNGRYAGAAAAMSRTRLTNAQVLQTTNAYFGDGAYAVSGNTITFTADGDRGHSTTRRFRLEQESSDAGTTWTDRLCLLQEGVGEVCYQRER